MKQKKSALREALLASCSFAGYNIGSGFATGIEAQQFFASWGSPKAYAGLFAALLSVALSFLPVYLAGFRKKADPDYNVYHYYCGEKIGTLIDWYIYFSVFVVILAMMSGAGATISQYFGIPKVTGVVVLSVLCTVAALLGLEKLMHILSYAGVLIVIFIIGCTVFLRFGAGISAEASFDTAEALVESGGIRRISLPFINSPVMCGIASTGLLIISSLPWVASTGALCGSEKSAVLSGTLSGLIFYLAEGVMVYLNLICMDAIAGQEVPVLAVFQRYLPSLAMAYSCIIILAIFSTVSGRLFLLADRFSKGNRKARVLIILGTVLFASVGGTFLSFSGVSNFMFSLNGFLGILLGIVILFRSVFRKEEKV